MRLFLVLVVTHDQFKGYYNEHGIKLDLQIVAKKRVISPLGKIKGCLLLEKFTCSISIKQLRLSVFCFLLILQTKCEILHLSPKVLTKSSSIYYGTNKFCGDHEWLQQYEWMSLMLEVRSFYELSFSLPLLLLRWPNLQGWLMKV